MKTLTGAAMERLAVKRGPDGARTPRRWWKWGTSGLLALCAGAAFAGPPDYPEYGTHFLDGTTPEESHPADTTPAPALPHDAWYWAGSWQTMMFCQVADILSTEWAFKHNKQASEDNAIPAPVLYTIKLGIPLGMWKVGWNDMDQPGIRAGVNALACLYTINNISVGRGGRGIP